MLIARLRHTNSIYLLAIVFSIAIFVLPSNLFKVWRLPDAYLAGHFIDYLAPKLYLSQLIIWFLWLITLLTTRGRAHLKANFGRLKSSAYFALGLCALTILHFLIWRDLSTVWWILGFLAGPFLLLVWILVFPALQKYWLWWSLLTAATIQAIIGIQQYITQSSWLGYDLLGEATFLPNQGLAVSNFSSTVHWLPYGTTPHPNVLAAWLVIGILSAFFLWYINNIKSWLIVISTGLIGLCLWWTESWTAWLSLPILLGSWLIIRAGWLERFGLFSAKIVAVSLICLIQLIWLSSHLWLTSLTSQLDDKLLNNTSIERRIHLQVNAINYLEENPAGTSLTKYYQSVYQAEQNYTGTRFLQPVHHAGLYFVIVMGVWTIIVLLLFVYLVHNIYSLYFLISLAVLPIFNLDHYLLSLLSGQYILILLLCYFVILTYRYRHYK